VRSFAARAPQAHARGCSLEQTARLAARFSVQSRSAAASPSLRAGKAARRSALVRLLALASRMHACARALQQPARAR
jgi:hypothetical protein